jgi:uncharacterized protein (TIGR03382 family)
MAEAVLEMAQRFRQSTGFLLIGVVIVFGSAALFLWGVSQDFTPPAGFENDGPMQRIGEVAGATGAVGLVMVGLALLQRRRGK